MTTINNTMFALASGLLASVLASSSATAQVSKPSPGFIPGQPFAITIEDGRGTPLMVVLAGRIPLESDPRIELFLPDLESFGDQEDSLVYALSIQTESSLGSEMGKKSQEVAGRVHLVYEKAAAGATLGQSDGSSGLLISISASGLQHEIVHDLSDDIVNGELVLSDPIAIDLVLSDPDVHIDARKPRRPAGQASQAILGRSDGVLTGGGAGSKNAATEVGSKAGKSL